MKVLLVHAAGDGDARSSPYRGQAFLGALAANGLDLTVVDVTGGTPAAPRPALPPVPSGIAHRIVAANVSPWRALVGDAGLAALCREQAPDLIQTLGTAPQLAPVWPALAAGRVPIVHAVAAGGPVGEGPDELLDPCARIRPALRSLTGMMARRASRHVSALIGSNRRDIGRHRELGFFPASRFSMVAGIPVPLAPDETPRSGAVPPPPWPRFGYFNPDHTPASWSFLREAVSMVGSSSFTLAVAPDPGSAARGASACEAVAVLADDDAAALVEAVDALVVPYADDCFAEPITRALVAGRVVIASDNGLNAELLDYGRRGILFANGNGSDLADKMLDVIMSWHSRAMSFDVAEEVMETASPRRCAAVFTAAYERMMAATGAPVRATAGR
ncbi:MAG: glycosyltransferase [Xanthobacteraceae bacterium]